MIINKFILTLILFLSTLHSTQITKFPDYDAEPRSQNSISHDKKLNWVIQSGPVSQKIFLDYFDAVNTDETSLIESIKIQRKKGETIPYVFIVLRKLTFDQTCFMTKLQNALGRQFIDLTYDADSSIQSFHRIRMLLNNIDDISKIMTLFHHDHDIPEKIMKKIVTIKSLSLPNYYFKDDAITNLIKDKFDNKKLSPQQLCEIEGFIFQKLGSLSDPLECQTSCLNLINYFWPGIKGAEKLVYKLCEQITLSELPMFRTARIIMAQILMTKERTHSTPIEHFYLKPIMLLLDVANGDDAMDLLDQYINDFINNGVACNDNELTVNNISVTPKSIFRLLNILRIKNMQIDALTHSSPEIDRASY